MLPFLRRKVRPSASVPSRRVHVPGKFLGEELRDLVIGQRIEGRAFALPKPAKIHGKNVNPRSGQPLRQIVPDLPLSIALMQEEYAGTRLDGSEEAGFQLCAVWRR